MHRFMFYLQKFCAVAMHGDISIREFAVKERHDPKELAGLHQKASADVRGGPPSSVPRVRVAKYQ